MPRPRFGATLVAGSDASTAWVRLVGEVDLASDDELVATAGQLSGIRPQIVCIDLAGVTFASATLATFLVRVKAAAASDAPLVLWRTPVWVWSMLDAAGLGAILVHYGDAPTAAPPSP
jgi:anti-anti-sigma regulatory factor